MLMKPENICVENGESLLKTVVGLEGITEDLESAQGMSYLAIPNGDELLNHNLLHFRRTL